VSISDLRQAYHRNICEQVLALYRAVSGIEVPDRHTSANIAQGIAKRLACPLIQTALASQCPDMPFKQLTQDFLQEAFQLLDHIRPGRWFFSQNASRFEEYEYVADLLHLFKANTGAGTSPRGSYVVTPDIMLGKYPMPDSEINRHRVVASPGSFVAQHTPLRASNRSTAKPMLHASISCKWALCGGKGQGNRTEALNLMYSQKVHIPHIIAVTAEPLPTRIASLALGTGDLDCVYHFALYELQETIAEIDNQDQMDMLQTLIEGRRLRDISDLPFDLAT